MKNLMLLSSAAILAMSGAANAQTTVQDTAGLPAAAESTTSTAPAEPGQSSTDTSIPQAHADAAQDKVSPPAAATPAAPATADATAASPAPSQPAPATAAADPAPAAPSSAPQTQTASADASAKVNADWAKYDEGNKGKLTPLEFGNWVMAARGQDVTAQVDKTKTSKKANLPAVKVLNATATDFAKADTDKDHAISPTELAAYLSA